MAKEIPLYKDKDYVAKLEAVRKYLTEEFKKGSSYMRGSKGNTTKEEFLNKETYNRAMNAIIAQPDRLFEDLLNSKISGANRISGAELARKIVTKETDTIRKFQWAPGMEGHHLLHQNVMGWFRDIPAEKALEVMDAFRKQGGTSGVVFANLAPLSRKGHSAGFGDLLKDAVNN